MSYQIIPISEWISPALAIAEEPIAAQQYRLLKGS
jgi:hypothetical protein